MNLNEMTFDKAQPFEGYGPGFFRVGTQAYQGAIVVTETGVQSWGGFDDADTLVALAEKVDVIFVGTGKDIAHVPAALRAAVEGAGMGLEVMNSPAACRTYNVVLGEGRRVAAAVLPVS